MIDKVLKAIEDEQALTEKWITQLSKEIEALNNQIDTLKVTLVQAHAEKEWFKVMKDMANDTLKGQAMPRLTFSKDQVDTAIESLEDYINVVTKEHEKHDMTDLLHTTLIDTVSLLEVFKNASQDYSTKQSQP